MLIVNNSYEKSGIDRIFELILRSMSTNHVLRTALMKAIPNY